MSRFQQTTYLQVLKEAKRRYLVRKKEKLLWKPKFFKQWIITWIVLIFLIIGFLWFDLFINSDIGISGYILLSCAYAVLSIPLVFFYKSAKFKKRKTPISLIHFVDDSNNLNSISKVYIRSIRYVLGRIYQINSCQIYSTDTSEKLTYLTGRYCSPFAFELILGVANRLSIPLSEENVDQIIDKICNCENVEELISKLSKELELRRGRKISNAIDFAHPIKEQEKRRTRKYILGGCFLGGLYAFLVILFDENNGSVLSDALGTMFSLTIFGGLIGGLMGWGDVKLGNLQYKNNRWVRKRQLASLKNDAIGKFLYGGLPCLLRNDTVSKYLYFFLIPLPVEKDITIQESEPLMDLKKEEIERIPLFCEISTHLKILMELEDCFYEQPIERKLEFDAKNGEGQLEKYHFTVTICDGIENAYITFRRNNVKEGLETAG